MTKIVPFSTVFSIKFSFFLLFFAAVFLFSGCGGSTKIEPVSNTDEDSTDADFDTDEEDSDEDEETEDEEETDTETNTETDTKPDKDTDSDKADKSDDDNDSGKPTRTECRNAGGTWDESDETCYKIHDCDSKPENTKWNGWNEYTQYYENAKWSEPAATEYNEEPGECHFICSIKNDFWDGTECKNRCDSDPCAEVEHSDGICTTTTPYIHYCGCLDGYTWNKEECKEISAKLSLGNICTCQSECYLDVYQKEITCSAEGKDFFGQDAVYAALGTCVRKNYSIKETGVENENIIVDKNLKLEWQQTIPAEIYTWQNAVNYCEDLEYGGYDDWRLPAPKELFAVIDICRCDPETTGNYFKETRTFWTSKLYAGNPNQVWHGNFGSGDMFYDAVGKKREVRCVRGETIPEDTFIVSTVSGDEIVTDSATGLIWQKGHAAGKRWKEALEYCENLIYAGYSDWRLPNINELVSLANYDKHSPSSDFPDIPHEYFWSSTTDTRLISAMSAWTVFFHTAAVISGSKDIFYYAKCVR